MNTESKTSNPITDGVIWKQLLIFFFPIMVGTLFQQLYNTVDAVIVGRFVGKQALASVGGSAAVLSNFVIGFFTGLSSGATVIIAQYYGAKDEKNLNKGLHTAYAFSIIASILISIIGWFATPGLLRLLKTPADTIPDSILYLRIYFLGIIFTLIYNMGSAIMRALGDSKRPLYYLIVCCFLNIVLDLFTVVVLNMGIAGAAIATVISQAVSAALVTRSLMKSYDLLKLRLRAIRIHPDLLRAEFRIGLPGGLQSCAYSISNIIIQAAINNLARTLPPPGPLLEKWTPFSGPSADPSASLLPPLPARTSEPAGLTASRKVSGYALPWPWGFPVSCWSFCLSAAGRCTTLSPRIRPSSTSAYIC